MALNEKALVASGEAGAMAGEGVALPPRTQMGPTWEAAKTVGLRAGSIAAMMIVWWVMTFFFSASLVPRPSETLLEVASIVSSGSFFAEMGATLRRVGIGRWRISSSLRSFWASPCRASYGP